MKRIVVFCCLCCFPILSALSAPRPDVPPEGVACGAFAGALDQACWASRPLDLYPELERILKNAQGYIELHKESYLPVFPILSGMDCHDPEDVMKISF